MSYLVLARKYRPKTFEEVVEQAHVTRTLTNAIRSGRVAHAILFSGPRGTGKTTIARILAKAMNCEQGPTPVPCNNCTSCLEIAGGSAVDVFEIDGASNNGVDHIRDLRENVKYMPARSRYKIYIIDEVHMLSTPAFNALLKTLEEPPEHILFLFATTEPQKIPITILSRCQQHHLRRINAMDVARHMAELCRREGLAVPDESLALIARETGGSMRDALSLLDQVMSCTEGDISHEKVLNLLGVAGREMLFRVTEGVFAGNLADILEIIDEVFRGGRDMKAFYAALTAHFRDLRVVKTVREAERIVEATPAEIDRMRTLVETVSPLYLSQLLDTFLREEAAIRFSSQPRLALEMAFIRLLQIRPALPIESILEHLKELTRRVAAAPDRPADAPSRMREPDPPAIAPPDGPSTSGTDWPATSGRRYPGSPVACDTPANRFPEMKEAPPQPEPSPAENPSQETAPDGPGECRLPESVADRVYHPGDPPARTWEKLTALVCERSQVLGSYLTRSTLHRIGDGEIEIGVQGNAFNLKQVQKKQGILEEAARAFFGHSVRLSLRLEESGGDLRQNKIEQANAIRQEATNHPLVAAAIEIFDGTVVDVKIL